METITGVCNTGPTKFQSGPRIYSDINILVIYPVLILSGSYAVDHIQKVCC
jgi:hypothetical protein